MLLCLRALPGKLLYKACAFSVFLFVQFPLYSQGLQEQQNALAQTFHPILDACSSL